LLQAARKGCKGPAEEKGVKMAPQKLGQNKAGREPMASEGFSCNHENNGTTGLVLGTGAQLSWNQEWRGIAAPTKDPVPSS